MIVPQKIEIPELYHEDLEPTDLSTAPAGDQTFIMLKATGSCPFQPRSISSLTYAHLSFLSMWRHTHMEMSSIPSLQSLFANKSPIEQQAALSLAFSSPMCVNASFLAVRFHSPVLPHGDLANDIEMASI